MTPTVKPLDAFAVFDAWDEPVSVFEKDGTYAYVNRAGRALVGRIEEQLVGRTYLDAFPDLASHPFHEAFQRTASGVSTGESLEFFYEPMGLWSRQRFVLAEGRITVFWENITSRKRAESDLVEALAAARDGRARIAEALEAEHLARANAEEAARLKDEFLSVLSHELRTPLTSILGWAQILRQRALAPERQIQALDIIVRNARSQNQLIDDLLDVARIMSGKLRLEAAPLALGELVRAVVESARPSAEARSIALVVRIASVEVDVVGDAMRLQQVVGNLLTNAVKFTSAGGRVDVTLDREGTTAVLRVADQGIGIASSFLPFVFDRFRQQDGTSQRETGGLGLGLAIVRSLTELHGGTVEAASEGTGRGSTFTLRLPLAEGAARPPRGPRAALDDDRSLKGLRVLVVDDREDARELTRFVLDAAGAEVVTAENGAEALASLATRPFDVLVSDIGMPRMNGYDMVVALRASAPEVGGAVPALALTAYARPEDRARALASGFQRYASKPLDPADLVDHVARLANR